MWWENKYLILKSIYFFNKAQIKSQKFWRAPRAHIFCLSHFIFMANSMEVLFWLSSLNKYWKCRYIWVQTIIILSSVGGGKILISCEIYTPANNNTKCTKAEVKKVVLSEEKFNPSLSQVSREVGLKRFFGLLWASILCRMLFWQRHILFVVSSKT